MLSVGVSGDLFARLQDDLRVEIEFILIILPAVQSFVPFVASKESQHVEIREMVLNTLQRRQRRGSVRIHHLFVSLLYLLRPRRNLPARLEVRDRFEDVLCVFGLVSNLVRYPTTLDSIPCGLDVFVRDWRLTVLLGQLRADTK